MAYQEYDSNGALFVRSDEFPDTQWIRADNPEAVLP